MRRSPAERANLHVAAQVAAAWAKLDAAHRAGELAGALGSQDRTFLGAMREMQAVRDFVGSPENILGSTDTKHGEIAEQVHVGVRRALDVLYGRVPAATFDGVPRTGPVDYRVDSVEIQSKYYNGLRNTLEGVSKHAESYPDFASTHGRYHIPTDQHRQLDELRRTREIEGVSGRRADGIRGSLDDLEQTTGRSADDLIEPGEATYAEVQQGRIHDTIRKREDVLDRENKELKRAARSEHGSSLAGFGQAAALGATAGGGVGLAQAIWVKHREGRSPFRGEFSTQDWRDVGVVAAQGAGGGAVAGSALYVVTNSTVLAAPFAGALVSGLMGIGGLLRDYDAGTIDCDQFVEMTHNHRPGRSHRGIGNRGRPDANSDSVARRPHRQPCRQVRRLGPQGRTWEVGVGVDRTARQVRAVRPRAARRGVPRLHATVGHSVRKPGTPSRSCLRSVCERLAPVAGQYCTCGDYRRA